MTSAVPQEDRGPVPLVLAHPVGDRQPARLPSTPSDPAPIGDASLKEARFLIRCQPTSRWLQVLVYRAASAIEVGRDHDTVLRSSRSAVGGRTRSTSSSVVRPSRSLAMASVASE
jgi:hypothetical protein